MHGLRGGTGRRGALPVMSAILSGDTEETFAPMLGDVSEAPARAGTSANPTVRRALAGATAKDPGDCGKCPLPFGEIAGSSIIMQSKKRMRRVQAIIELSLSDISSNIGIAQKPFHSELAMQKQLASLPCGGDGAHASTASG